MSSRKNEPYQDGELEVILSVVPTHQNIRFLSELLSRSEASIKIVYRIAYGEGPFGMTARSQVRKIMAAKRAVGIAVGGRKIKIVSEKS